VAPSTYREAARLVRPAEGANEHVSERAIPEVRGDAIASHRSEADCVSERAP
jgi:hypothetical protein